MAFEVSPDISAEDVDRLVSAAPGMSLWPAQIVLHD